MAVDPTSVLWGESFYGDEPWYQYDATIVTEVSQCACSFLHATIGIQGTFHDQHGWIVDMPYWSALRQYVQWCIDGDMDFLWHAEQVSEGDVYYTQLAVKQMTIFLNRAVDCK